MHTSCSRPPLAAACRIDKLCPPQITSVAPSRCHVPSMRGLGVATTVSVVKDAAPWATRPTRSQAAEALDRDATATASTSYSGSIREALHRQQRTLPMHNGRGKLSVSRLRRRVAAAASATAESAPAAASSEAAGGAAADAIPQLPHQSVVHENSPAEGVQQEGSQQQEQLQQQQQQAIGGEQQGQQQTQRDAEGGHQQQHEQQPQRDAASAAREAGGSYGAPHGLRRKRVNYNDQNLQGNIKGCASAEQLLSLVALQASRMSAVSAVQALQRLAQLLRSNASRDNGAQAPAALPMTREQAIASPTFAALLDVVASQLPEISARTLANLIYALGQLRMRAKDLPEMLVNQLVRQIGELACQFNARDVSMLLYGLASMGFTPDRKVIDAVADRGAELLPLGGLDSQAISMIMYSCAVLKYDHERLIDACLDRAVKQINEFAPQGISNVVWACGHLRTYHRPLLRGALDVFTSRPKEFKPQEVCNLLWAMTALKHDPQDAMGPMLLALASRCKGMGVPDLAQLFYACGVFGVHPGSQALDAFCARLEQVGLKRCGPLEVCNVYWGMAMIRETRHPLFKRIAAQLHTLFAQGRMEESLRRQAFQAYLCAKLADVAEVADEGPAAAKAKAGQAGGKQQAAAEQAQGQQQEQPGAAFPPDMIEAMRSAWISSVNAHVEGVRAHAAHTPSANAAGAADDSAAPAAADAVDGAPAPGQAPAPSSSQVHARPPLHVELSSILRDLRVRHDMARPTRDGLVCVDLALRPTPERYVALQIVTEHDQTVNTRQLLAGMRFQREVLHMNGWEVRYLRVSDFKSAKGPARLTYVAELLNSFGFRIKVPPLPTAAGAGGATASAPSGADAAEDGFDSRGLDLLIRRISASDAQRARAKSGGRRK